MGQASTVVTFKTDSLSGCAAVVGLSQGHNLVCLSTPVAWDNNTVILYGIPELNKSQRYASLKLLSDG